MTKLRPELPLAMLILAGSLQGCPAPVYQLNRQPASSPLPQAIAIPAEGTYAHEPSGYSFPLAIGDFRRVAVMRYDTAGLDVSAGYNAGAQECPVRLTIYVSPAPRMSFIGADPAVVKAQESQWLNSAYGHWKQEIGVGHPQARLLSEDTPVQEGAPGKKAVYAIDGDQSELYVFLEDRTWFLTYRDSFPATCEPWAHEALRAFFAGWHGREKR